MAHLNATTKYKFEIDSVERAVGLFEMPFFKRFRAGLVRSVPTFGTWFRGHGTVGLLPMPGAFRPIGHRKTRNWDETSIVNHFRLRAADHQGRCRSTFDWLCLMRHFELPTRLLDWTENVLVALFFAVEDESKAPGEVFVLNTKLLNRSSPVPGVRAEDIDVPEDLRVALRAEMARANSVRAWRFLIDSLTPTDTFHLGACREMLDRLDTGLGERDALMQELPTPIAVFPRYLDTRIKLQQSVFTIHGGKVGAGLAERSDGGIPSPIALSELTDASTFLMSVRVVRKSRIKAQLAALGIHRGSLFPELDQMKRYLEALWWVDPPR